MVLGAGEEEGLVVETMLLVLNLLPQKIQFDIFVSQTRQRVVLEMQLPVLGDGGRCFGLEEEVLLCNPCVSGEGGGQAMWYGVGWHG